MKTVRQWRAPLLLALGLTLLVVVAGELGAVLPGRGGDAQPRERRGRVGRSLEAVRNRAALSGACRRG